MEFIKGKKKEKREINQKNKNGNKENLSSKITYSFTYPTYNHMPMHLDGKNK